MAIEPYPLPVDSLRASFWAKADHIDRGGAFIEKLNRTSDSRVIEIFSKSLERVAAAHEFNISAYRAKSYAKVGGIVGGVSGAGFGYSICLVGEPILSVIFIASSTLFGYASGHVIGLLIGGITGRMAEDNFKGDLYISQIRPERKGRLYYPSKDEQTAFFKDLVEDDVVKPWIARNVRKYVYAPFKMVFRQFCQDMDDMRGSLESRTLKPAVADAVRSKLGVFEEMSPKSMLCPLKKEFPIFPVKAPDGCFYERLEIECWIESQARAGLAAFCPMDTRKPLKKEDLKDDFSCIGIIYEKLCKIDEWYKKHPRTEE